MVQRFCCLQSLRLMMSRIRRCLEKDAQGTAFVKADTHLEKQKLDTNTGKKEWKVIGKTIEPDDIARYYWVNGAKTPQKEHNVKVARSNGKSMYKEEAGQVKAKARKDPVLKDCKKLLQFYYQTDKNKERFTTVLKRAQSAFAAAASKVNHESSNNNNNEPEPQMMGNGQPKMVNGKLIPKRRQSESVQSIQSNSGSGPTGSKKAAMNEYENVYNQRQDAFVSVPVPVSELLGNQYQSPSYLNGIAGYNNNGNQFDYHTLAALLPIVFIVGLLIGICCCLFMGGGSVFFYVMGRKSNQNGESKGYKATDPMESDQVI